MSHTYPREFADEEHEANAMPHIPDHRKIVLDKINRVEAIMREEW